MKTHSVGGRRDLSEVIQKRPELKRKVMGLVNERKIERERERERDDCYLACLQTRLRLPYL